VTTEAVAVCPECRSPRTDLSVVCPTCGAPPERPGDEKRGQDEEVRTADLEPYMTLRYIAKLFKVLAALMLILLVGEIVLGLTAQGTMSLPDLIAEITRMLVLAGLLWSLGDLTLLIIDAGHDLRVARILLGRINAELHRRGLDPDLSRKPLSGAGDDRAVQNLT
jgi:hypothetical protein